MTPITATRKLLIMAAVLGRHPAEIPYGHRWLRSLLPGHSPLSDELPWITFRAIDWLDAYLRPDMSVFEFGAGGSTLFFADRVRKLVSIEHDKGFFELVRSMLAERGVANCELILHQPRQCTAASAAFASRQEKYIGMCFENYVKAIDRCADASLDLVLVDGRARVACVRRALPKLKDGGVLVLDNTDRPGYQDAYTILEGSECHDFDGLTPWNMEVSRTTVWQVRR